MTCNRSIFSLTLIVCLTFTATAGARDWYEYQSDHFTVYSDVSQKRTEQLLRDMERFRSASLFFTGQEDRPESHRLQIYYFHSRSEFRDFSGDHKVAGFYRDTWNGPLIFAQKGSRRGLPGTGVMFHEYVHHLMRSRSQTTYPAWYSEGFAELLASADLDDDRISVGKIPTWRANVFDGSLGRPLKVEELLAPDRENNSPTYWHRFYGSAWLLTHYLLIGAQEEHPEYHGYVAPYINDIAQGADPQVSFTEQFGISPDEMERQLRSLRRRGRIKVYSFDSPVYAGPITRKKVAPEEAHYLLAEKAMNVGKEELALEHLREALETRSGWTPALSFMAVLERHKGEEATTAKAANIVKNLTARKVVDGRTATHLAHYYVDHLQDMVANEQWDKGIQQTAIEYGQSAVALAPESVRAHRFLWMAQLDRNNPVPALKTMMAAYGVDPGSLRVNQQIAFYLSELGRIDLAKPFLERVVDWSHPGSVRRRAQNLLDRFAEELPEATEQTPNSGSEINQG